MFLTNEGSINSILLKTSSFKTTYPILCGVINFLRGGGWFESRVFLKSIHRALLTLNPYRSNFKPISKRRTHPSYQMIKSIIFVGCVRIYCCKDFNVCPQAAISKNKSDKILKNTSPAVNKITFVMRAAFLERTICKVLNSSVLKRGWVENLWYGKDTLFWGKQS